MKNAQKIRENIVIEKKRCLRNIWMVPKPQKPGRSPSLTDVRPLSPTSLRLGWVLLDSKTNEEIEGYFIYYKPSVSDEKYKKITILGATSHSFIIYGLIPGTEYDLKVNAT